jgi:hypothetical protein
MRICLRSLGPLFLVAAALATQPHVVAWGAWTSITLASGQQLKIRPIIIDGRIKDYSTGAAHQVTENLGVARRVFRINNSLPDDSPKRPQWTWQLGGWISVNSTSGRISELNLPDFDPHTSQVSWFQDYAAYCGATEDATVHYMMVFQLGKRKPVLRKELYGQSCTAPKWERDPSRVSFEPAGGAKVSFLVHDGSAELQSSP